jgi:hypothetical protein
MQIIPKPIIINKLQDDVFPYMGSYPVTTANLILDYNIDYANTSIILQNFIDSLTIYVHSDLGTDDTHLNNIFSSSINEPYFILDADPEYLLCYTKSGNQIELSVNLENFTP